MIVEAKCQGSVIRFDAGEPRGRHKPKGTANGPSIG